MAESVGEAIRKFRRARGLTQAVVADTVMSGPYWSKIENNRKGVPKVETLTRVVVAFELTGMPLTNEELLELFLAALNSVKTEWKLGDVQYET